MVDSKNSGGGVVVPANNPDQQTSRSTSGVGALADLPFKKVVVHPLVLLSVVDHFNRMGKIGNQKRVVGILLGAIKGKGILDISNSFASKILSLFEQLIFLQRRSSNFSPFRRGRARPIGLVLGP